MTFRRRTLLAAAALLAGATALLLVARRGPSGSLRERAAPQVAAMTFEASLEVVRPGTPAGEIAAVNGLTRLPYDPARETAAEVRRRSELRVRWPAPEPRVALLDLEAPPVPAYAVLRVLLNGFRVARLEVAPPRSRGQRRATRAH